MMDNFILRNLKKDFGTYFQQYCLHHKMLIKKNKCSACIVSNVCDLKKCIVAVNRLKFNINRNLKKLQTDALFINSLNPIYYIPKLDEQYKIQEKINRNDKQDKQYKIKKEKNFHKEITYHNIFLNNLNLNIFLCNTSQILPHYTNYKSSICILNIDKKGHEIYDFITKGSRKNTIAINYEDYFLLIEKFQNRHKKFNYYSVLKHLICKQKYNEKTKCIYEVNKKQLKNFFDLIFAKVVPKKLFGSIKNLKKIKRATFQLLDTPCFKYFNLKPIIEKLDINITWLQNVTNVKTKWLVIAQFVKWFFTEFLFNILYIYFHITKVSGNTNERLYITRFIWNNIQKKFIKEGIHSNTLQPNIKRNTWNPSIGIYKLFCKYSDVRPIFKLKKKSHDADYLFIIFKFLKQLYATNYEVINFPKKWKSIVQKLNSKIKKLYFVCCDVINAFGSIIQVELYNIIQSLCKDLPENLILKYYTIKSEISKKDNTYHKYFSDLQLPFPSDQFYANLVDNQWYQLINKSWLLESISKYIFYQRIKINENIHIIGKGIVQGSMLSPILSDIYYNYILNKEMSTYLKTGEIIKYMDDILYITENKTLAEQFLELTKKGIPQYNCYFKQSKTQSNLISDRNKIVKKNIIYIGYKINCNTLEIGLKRSDTALCHSISFLKPSKSSLLKHLSMRLSNVATFRLSKVMLDHTINSKRTIMRILKEHNKKQIN
ncbi:uncharacterized protein LOC107992902 isoform X2 [Apis cerana]|uniref:uncharacterized protein LOC107992902 isoform X2 n=1 Tax=Apis cerana TaxID=7461 RepID=UPI00109BD2FF|nr:uncharacterized protein LOC107992902 isoform X2 [Apis cerana]